MDVHEKEGEFWITIESDMGSSTYAHQLGDDVLLRVSGNSSPVESITQLENCSIVPTFDSSGDESGYTIVKNRIIDVGDINSVK